MHDELLMLTAEQLKKIMPGLSDQRTREFLPFLQAAMTEFGIEAPARAAAFLAQLAHESGQLRFMEEIWGPTAAQRRYEPASPLATDLGNTEAGDGRRFKGRGPIQITGRSNYRRFGDLLGIALVEEPSRAAVPDLAFRIAGLFWSKKGLNQLADRADDVAFREITRRINGGFNGLEERRKFYAAARTVLRVPEASPSGAERDLRAPEPAEEPEFERGDEAIRSHVRRRGTGEGALGGRKTKTALTGGGRTKNPPAKSKVAARRKTGKVPARKVSRRRKTSAGPTSRAATPRPGADKARNRARPPSSRRKK